VRLPLRGEWRPATTNPTLLAVQLVTLLQVAFRGLDYLHSQPAETHTSLAAVEQAASLPVWGWLFYCSAVLVLVGLAARRSAPVVLGHALLFAWYCGIGFPVLAATTGPLPLTAWTGCLLGAVGVWGVVTDRVKRTATRVLVAIPVMLIGQLLLAEGMGSGYRTGTGLIAAGALQLALAVGTALTASRQHLVHVVELEAVAGTDGST
jgi:hypothetical protein